MNQTYYPSISPSSASPTLGPTKQCHDVESYRSPINDLQCSHHNGTDCFQWRFLGLDSDQLEELLRSCPVSCGIDCGSLLRFQVVLKFRMFERGEFFIPKFDNKLGKFQCRIFNTYSSCEAG